MRKIESCPVHSSVNQSPQQLLVARQRGEHRGDEPHVDIARRGDLLREGEAGCPHVREQLVDHGGIERGDEIVLMWDGFDADDMAAIAGTISYEILTSVTKRVPRKYVNG